MPREYRKDGRCPLCAGLNFKENRANCTQCWNEYHTSRHRYFKAIARAQLVLDELQAEYRRRVSDYIGTLPPKYVEGWESDLRHLKDQLAHVRDHSWKEWLNGRKSGKIPQGDLYSYDVKTDPNDLKPKTIQTQHPATQHPEMNISTRN